MPEILLDHRLATEGHAQGTDDLSGSQIVGERLHDGARGVLQVEALRGTTIVAITGSFPSASVGVGLEAANGGEGARPATAKRIQ